MQGRKSPPDAPMFISQDPYGQLPRSRFYEALEQHLGLDWVRERTAGLYAEGVGPPSLDPVVFVKLMLVAYFENVGGDSELAFRAADSLTIRRFLGYGLEEATPERTTILKTRQRWPEEVFGEIFLRVLEQLASRGLVKGEHLGTDTVLIDANAAMASLVHREFGCRYHEFVRALYSQPQGERLSASEVALKDGARPQKGSNAEWVSTTDPEAAVAVHPDGHTALSYRLDAVVDLDTGAIVSIGAEPGNVGDSVDLPLRVEEAKANLEQVGLEARCLTGDRGHHSEANVVELEAMGIDPILRPRTPKGAPGFRFQDFIYQPEEDVYRCPAGVELPRHDVRATGQVRYRVPKGVCQACAHFGVCTKAREGRTLQRPVHEEALARNLQRVRSVEGGQLLGQHRQRAEGPWSYAKLSGGLARMGPRGGGERRQEGTAARDRLERDAPDRPPYRIAAAGAERARSVPRLGPARLPGRTRGAPVRPIRRRLPRGECAETPLAPADPNAPAPPAVVLS